MSYSKLSFLFSTALACTLAGCGGDSGGDSGDDDSANSSGGSTSSGSGGTASGDGGSGGSSSGGSSSANNGTTSASTTGDGGGSACTPTGMGGGGSTQCTEYGECAQNACESEYAECMGPDAASGDFSGGSCESYMECASNCQSGDECDTACVADCVGDISSACQSCLIEAGQCGAEACPDEYEACNAEPTTSTGATSTGSTTGGGGGTCMDLEDCCNSLEEDAQTACQALLDGVADAGDEYCDIVLQSYQNTDQC